MAESRAGQYTSRYLHYQVYSHSSKPNLYKGCGIQPFETPGCSNYIPFTSSKKRSIIDQSQKVPNWSNVATSSANMKSQRHILFAGISPQLVIHHTTRLQSRSSTTGSSRPRSPAGRGLGREVLLVVHFLVVDQRGHGATAEEPATKRW